MGSGVRIDKVVASLRQPAAREPGTFFTDQINNANAIRGYERIGTEILAQLDRPIDVFCGAVGTAGMLMGVSKVVREADPGIRIAALEPASAPLLSRGQRGTHRVEGIGIGIVPPLLQPEAYDEVRTVDEAEACAMARRLAREEGILAGILSGLNIAEAVQLASELGTGHTVVTVACDSGIKYLAGDLFET